MAFVATELLKEATRVGMKMPQIVALIPSGYSITAEGKPHAGTGWINTGFMFGGHLEDGSAIPGYNFVNEEGVTWRGDYVNREPFKSRSSKTFYLTNDYLYKQIFYGATPVTEKIILTVENTLAMDVYLSTTAFQFELPIEKIIETFSPKRA